MFCSPNLLFFLNPSSLFPIYNFCIDLPELIHKSALSSAGLFLRCGIPGVDEVDLTLYETSCRNEEVLLLLLGCSPNFVSIFMFQLIEHLMKFGYV